MQKLFSIGNVAKMFHLSVSTLRHYEHIGILKPEYVDEVTGYRYYSTNQFEVLNTIRYLRALDMPLGEIAKFLQNREIQTIEEKLKLQKEEVVRKRKELERIEKKIDRRLWMLQDAQNCKLDEIELVKMPPGRLVWLEESLKIQGTLDMEESIRRLEESGEEGVVFLGKVGLSISPEHLEKCEFEQYDSVFLLLDQEDIFEGNILQMPESLCVRIRFCGSHKESFKHYKKLIKYIRNNKMSIDGFSREITLIDYGITNDTDKFVTEISIPIRAEK